MIERKGVVVMIIFGKSKSHYFLAIGCEHLEAFASRRKKQFTAVGSL